MVRYVRFYTRWHRRENDQFSTLRCTKTGSTQPKLSAACFVVQSCLADADFVVFSNYCLIGTRQKADYNRGTVQNVRDIGQENSGTGGKVPTSETELAQSINHLSESLKQIAASREQPEEMLKDSDRLDLIRNSIPPAELDMLKTLFNTLQSGGV